MKTKKTKTKTKAKAGKKRIGREARRDDAAYRREAKKHKKSAKDRREFEKLVPSKKKAKVDKKSKGYRLKLQRKLEKAWTRVATPITFLDWVQNVAEDPLRHLHETAKEYLSLGKDVITHIGGRPVDVVVIKQPKPQPYFGMDDVPEEKRPAVDGLIALLRQEFELSPECEVHIYGNYLSAELKKGGSFEYWHVVEISGFTPRGTAEGGSRLGSGWSYMRSAPEHMGLIAAAEEYLGYFFTQPYRPEGWESDIDEKADAEFRLIHQMTAERWTADDEVKRIMDRVDKYVGIARKPNFNADEGVTYRNAVFDDLQGTLRRLRTIDRQAKEADDKIQAGQVGFTADEAEFIRAQMSSAAESDGYTPALQEKVNKLCSDNIAVRFPDWAPVYVFIHERIEQNRLIYVVTADTKPTPEEAVAWINRNSHPDAPQYTSRDGLQINGPFSAVHGTLPHLSNSKARPPETDIPVPEGPVTGV